MPYRVKAKLAEEKYNLENRNVGVQILESGYRFFLGIFFIRNKNLYLL